MSSKPAAPTWREDDEETNKARESSLFVGSLEKGLQILRVFDRERRNMGLSEIVTASGFDKSSVQRFTFTLHALGFLRKDEATRKYALSPRVLELGFAYLQTDKLLEYAMPLLYEANRVCGESLNITELLGSEVVYVARVPGRFVISVDIFLGMRVPAYACAPGRAILAFLEEGAAAAIIDRSNLRKFTPKTIASRTGLLRELKKIRGLGYAIADEQCYSGELSIAAPIFNGQNQPIGALNVSVPNSRWSTERAEQELVPLVIDTARAVSQAQGGAGHPWFHQMPAALVSAPGKSAKTRAGSG
jgi:IclR family pca regulon transcriptional regulator